MQPENFRSKPVAARAGTVYDAGLNAFFRQVYNTMTIGLVFTGLVSWIVAHSPALLNFFYGTPLMSIVVTLAPLGFLFFGFTPRRIYSMSAAGMAGMFYAFSGVFGISLAYIFMAYSGESIARVFFITAATFASMSIYGYTTKKDLSSFTSLLMMGLWGVFLAFLVNLFLHSSMLNFVASAIGVLVYTGLVAWDTQRLKETYSSAGGGEANSKLAIMGALSLYINFITLFQLLLSFMGNRR